MVQVEFEPEVEEQVRRFAKEHQISESVLLREVMMRWIEDREDYAAGIRALANMKHTISMEEMDRLAELAD